MKQKIVPLPPDILAQKGGLNNMTPKRKSFWYSLSSQKKLCQGKRSFDVSRGGMWGSEQKWLMSIRVNCDPWRWWVAKDYPPWLHYSLLLIVIWKLWWPGWWGYEEDMKRNVGEERLLELWQKEVHKSYCHPWDCNDDDNDTMCECVVGGGMGGWGVNFVSPYSFRGSKNNFLHLPRMGRQRKIINFIFCSFFLIFKGWRWSGWMIRIKGR